MTDTNLPPDFCLHTILAEASEGVIITKADPFTKDGPEIVYVNRALEHISGYTSKELIGNTPRLLQGKHTSADTKATIRQHLSRRLPVTCNIMNERKNGETHWVRLKIFPTKNQRGEVTHFVCWQRELAGQPDSADTKQIADCSVHAGDDQNNTILSRGVLCKKDFLQALETEWNRAFRHHSTFSLLCIRAIQPNSHKQSGTGDLAVFTKIIQQLFRREDTVGGIADNEFAVLMPETSQQLAFSVVNRLTEALSKTPLLAGLTTLTGIAELDLLDQTPCDILARARLYSS